MQNEKNIMNKNLFNQLSDDGSTKTSLNFLSYASLSGILWNSVFDPNAHEGTI